MSTLGLRSLLGVAREARAGAAESRPLVLGGARELAALLAKELRAGGDAAAVVEHGSVEGAAALVWIGRPDEGVLRRAAQAKVPIVGVSDGSRLPYVLDTDLVNLPRSVPYVERSLNWVIVAQRFPVRIRLVDPPQTLVRLGATAVVEMKHGTSCN